MRAINQSAATGRSRTNAARRHVGVDGTAPGDHRDDSTARRVGNVGRPRIAGGRSPSRTLARRIPRVGVVEPGRPLRAHPLRVERARHDGHRRPPRAPRAARWLARFRATPDGLVEHGFTYNVSPGGLYVRTLAPPVDPHVVVEIQPPNVDKLVRLEGVVVWRRGFARLGTATAPPGFGMKITGGTEEDRATWARGCTQLLVAHRAPEKPPRADPRQPGIDEPTADNPSPRLSDAEELGSSDLRIAAARFAGRGRVGRGAPPGGGDARARADNRRPASPARTLDAGRRGPARPSPRAEAGRTRAAG